MKQRWSISTDDGIAWAEVHPVNAGKLGFTRARDLNAGQVFFRTKLNAAVVFSGEDYDVLRPIHFDPGTRCREILIRFDEYCSGWQETWRGVFSTGKGTWDLDLCTFEVRPDVVDAYTCILGAAKVKRNVLQVGPVDAEALNLPSLQFAMCATVGFTPSPADACDDFWSGSPFLSPLINEWLIGHSQVEAAGSGYQLNIFWRERLTTECIDGAPVAPPGSGWVLLSDDCAGSGMATYIRETGATWSFGDAQRGTIVDGIPVPPSGACAWQYVGSIDETIFDPFDPDLGVVPFYVCLSDGDGTDLNRARRMDEIIEHLIDQSGCPIAGLRSDFFERNPVGDALGYVAGENYVTGEINQVSNILMLQKSDAITPAATNPATIGEWSFDEAMKFCLDVFRCLWFIDADGYVRIEHYSYFVALNGLDLELIDGAIEPLRYEHLSDRIPRIERAKWAEAQGRDFVGRDIVYDGPCVGDGNREVEEISPGPYTTDISYIFNDPDAIGKEGFVFLATTLDGGVYTTILDIGAFTGNLISNAPLSWANLQDAFWRSDRYLRTGNMNGVVTDFDGWRPNVEQKGVSIPRCCDTYDFDPLESIGTRLGALLLPPRRAVVESVAENIDDGRITLTLRYQY